ncbi:hypothetical protein ACFLXO_06150 [Chloroflexota bacterium]
MVINHLGQLEESEISILMGKLCVAEWAVYFRHPNFLKRAT